MNIKLTVEIDEKTAQALKARAAELGRRWAAVEAGAPTVAHDKVVRWLETWGTPSFRPWPEQ